MSAILQIKTLSEHATVPSKGSEFSAGYDLSSARDIIVPALGKALIQTDLAISIPYGTYGRVAPRSGLAWKHSIDVGAGVLDFDFRGGVGVILFNHGKDDFKVSIGDRIAQLILEKIEVDARLEVVTELSETKRGSGGFGSTGIGLSIYSLQHTSPFDK